MRLMCMLVLAGVCGAAWADGGAAAKPEIVSAAEWGSKPEPIPDSRKQVPKYITIHHAGVLYKAGTDPVKSIRGLQAYGQKEKHWPDLPYHFLIAPDGRIFEGRPVTYEPETNTTYKTSGHIGVELMGDFNRQRPSPQQLDSAVRLTAWLMQQYHIPPEDVRTHRDAAPGQTECPGRDFYRYFLDGQFKKWVAAVRAGRDPQIDPGPPLPAEPPGPTEVITETRARPTTQANK